MAQCKLTAREFITNAFSPQIGAVCSEAAELICQKNNLSFIELLQPFCNLTNEGTLKDPQGTTIVVRNIRLSIQNIYSQPAESAVARKLLSDCVTSEQCDRVKCVKIGKLSINIPSSVAWYEAWRQMFLKVQSPSDHEFTKHYLACLIVVSTSEDNPLEKIQKMAVQLNQQSSTISGKHPKWFNNNALRYYVLLDDVSQQENSNKIDDIFNEMKKLYGGNNCFLLPINSRPPGHDIDQTHLPDPWSQFLVKDGDCGSSGDNNSGPRTPADTGSVSSMPTCRVNNEQHERTGSNVAVTPVGSGPMELISPDVVDKMSLSSDMSDISHATVEVGQEAVPVTIHPLSPEAVDKLGDFHMDENKKLSSAPMNFNVWPDTCGPGRSTQPAAYAQHGSQLSSQDLDCIKRLISEFYLKSLLPYVERQMNLLNDVISAKKGVSRSLFSATKRWFGTNKPGNQSATSYSSSSSSLSLSGSASVSSSSSPSNAVVYSLESPELQLRRLGDLSFMFGHYAFAYQAYHSAKRDFAADQAWLYYAGALEMAGLSAFMQGEMSRKTIEYMDDAILTYSNSCKLPQFATRATLLSSECLKDKKLYGEAAKQLIRMTSEDSDLRSGLLLEQAAYCFIASQMIHKYAFHAVLAGHRYSKAGQRKHSLRCYQQAYEVYDKRGWSLAEDHIHFTIGRQAASLRQVENAAEAFGKLLNPVSKQQAPQQAAFLREFINIHQLILQESLNYSELPILPLPLIQQNQIKVLLGPFIRQSNDDLSKFDYFDDSNHTNWAKLEENLITQVQNSVPMIFKPTISLYTNKTNNTSRPNAIIDEPIFISVELNNPLRISLPLSKIKLIWSFNTSDGQQLTNENSLTENSLEESTLSVETPTIDAIILQPLSKQRIILSCTPTQLGNLNILGMSYNLSNSPNGTEQLIHGKSLFNIKTDNTSHNNINIKKIDKNGGMIDQRLNINVIDRAPFMAVSFTKIPSELLAGEIQRVDVTIENIGNASMKNIHVASSKSENFHFQVNNQTTPILCNNVTRISLPDRIDVNEKFTIPLWIRAPYDKGNHRLDLLFYYENSEPSTSLKYRLSRHIWQLTVLDSIDFNALARPSFALMPTINLVVQVKNSNETNDPLMHDIEMTRIVSDSKEWSLSLKSPIKSTTYHIKPQQICHLLLKLSRTNHHNDNDDGKLNSSLSSVSLTGGDDVENENSLVSSTICCHFAKKQKIKVNANDGNQNDLVRGGVKKSSNSSDPKQLDVNMIIMWRSKIMKETVVTRQAIGYHCIKIDSLNKLFKHPNSKEQPGSISNLNILGSEINNSSQNVVNFNENQDNLVHFSISHERKLDHDFCKNRFCIVQVTLNLENHSHSDIDITINTIGTTSQENSPSIKSQLYSPQASTLFRYACRSTIKCQIKANDRHAVTLSAIICAPGSYDLASRLKLYTKPSDSHDVFVNKNWITESLCIVNNNQSV